jgi:hypothetical protein
MAGSGVHVIINSWSVYGLIVACALLLLDSMYVCGTDQCKCLLKHQLTLAVIHWIISMCLCYDLLVNLNYLCCFN